MKTFIDRKQVSRIFADADNKAIWAEFQDGSSLMLGSIKARASKGNNVIYEIEYGTPMLLEIR